MKSISFPNMFRHTSTIVKNDSYDATYQNMLLVLGADKGEFVCDPYFGVRLRKYMYEPNNYILRDIIIDEIYTQLKVFMPQLLVKRTDITVVLERGKLIANIKVTNRSDFSINSYNLVLFNGDGEY